MQDEHSKQSLKENTEELTTKSIDVKNHYKTQLLINILLESMSNLLEEITQGSRSPIHVTVRLVSSGAPGQ